MTKRKIWAIPDIPAGTADVLAGKLGMSQITAGLLVNRGIKNYEQAQAFLNPSLHQLVDPCSDAQIRAAAAFLKDSIRRNKRITVYGDFDADGICACALMVRALQTAGASVDFYVPHRFDEGYGINIPALNELHDRGTDIVVTVDCGISANEAVKHANKIGLKIIVTDHHQQRGKLPEAEFLLNPQLDACRFGYKNLSGVGVAFKLAWTLGQSFGSDGYVSPKFKDALVDLLPLVAIGTVADMVPMEDENRIYVNYGLKLLPSAESPGLKALLKASGIAGNSRFSTYNIGFQMAPRLNAVGRMADACAAIEMLVTDDEAKAEQIAQELEKHNRRRQITQRKIIDEAMGMVESASGIDSCIMLSSPKWHPGVVGLVASRLSEKFFRPAFVFYEKDGIACGSARSVPGLHLFDAIDKCKDMLHRFGGHEGAAGMTLPVGNLELFKKSISDIIASMTGKDAAVPRLSLEAEVELKDLSPHALEEISLLEPFGEGNPRPLFAATGLKIAGNPQLVGSRRNHLSFLAGQNGISMRVIAFGRAEWLDKLKSRRDQEFNLAFEPRINSYNFSREVELRAEEIGWPDDHGIEYNKR